MKYSVLKVRNLYRQPGREDESVRSECALLTRAGHIVIEYGRDNRESAAYSFIEKASLGPRTVWAWDSCEQIRAVLRAERSDFAHLPSEWYEAFGRVAAEALACGVPLIASRLGAMEEIVTDGRTGLHFTPGNADDLAAKVDWTWLSQWRWPRWAARRARSMKPSTPPKRNYAMLIGIYERTSEAYQQS